ncbi:MAG: hypothetical protein IIB03_10615, partial [Acidobacteria bacterium]|nr:hypothetical protein [Acidobacteriota bacterium]
MSDLELNLEGDSLAEMVPSLKWEGTPAKGEPLDLTISEEDLEDLRWLQEDPLVDLFEPGTGRRGRAEMAVARIGDPISQAFSATEGMRTLLAQALAPGKTPSLLIGTADKYTQITRKRETGRLFGIETENGPPDVIVQDELHLISGPLGTLAGIYEIAIDEFCAWAGTRQKVIGSTATIRHAEDQLKALSDR